MLPTEVDALVSGHQQGHSMPGLRPSPQALVDFPSLVSKRIKQAPAIRLTHYVPDRDVVYVRVVDHEEEPWRSALDTCFFLSVPFVLAMNHSLP